MLKNHILLIAVGIVLVFLLFVPDKKQETNEENKPVSEQKTEVGPTVTPTPTPRPTPTPTPTPTPSPKVSIDTSKEKPSLSVELPSLVPQMPILSTVIYGVLSNVLTGRFVSDVETTGTVEEVQPSPTPEYAVTPPPAPILPDLETTSTGSYVPVPIVTPVRPEPKPILSSVKTEEKEDLPLVRKEPKKVEKKTEKEEKKVTRVAKVKSTPKPTPKAVQKETQQRATPVLSGWYRYQDGARLAIEQKKLLLVKIGFNGCTPCEQLKAAMRQPDMAAVVDKRFIKVEVDYFNDPLYKTNFSKYQAFPTVIIMNPVSGARLHVFEGYSPTQYNSLKVLLSRF